jgi:hypothetical protein
VRKGLITFISICIFYFIGGYLAVKYGTLSEHVFLTYASILGGLASVAGLLSFLRPSITKTDIQELEVESLKKISKAAEDLERYKNQRTAAEQEIAKLTLQQEEMEFLLKKASLSLFLRDQMETTQTRIAELIEQNRELTLLLEKYGQNKEKLAALEEEIEQDPNADILYDVLTEAKESRRSKERSYPRDPLSEILYVMRQLLTK